MTEEEKQILYRDARRLGTYDSIWQSVGKCVFCDLRDKYIFREENGIVMTISLFAYIDGQLMIIPRRHIRSVKELTPLEWETVRKFVYIAKKLIRSVHGIKGMQFLQRDGGIDAQSTVEDHLHFQCTPFDAPDLSVWNYRKLKYTPIENVNLYKKAQSKIDKHAERFHQKYQDNKQLPIYCDALLVNSNSEILFHERAKGVKLKPDYLTQPGGRVENIKVPLEVELAREVKEETGVELAPSLFEIVNSKIDHITYEDGRSTSFIRNTYKIDNLQANIKLTPGDDSTKFVWVPIKKVAKHSRISPETKEIIQKVLSRNDQ